MPLPNWVEGAAAVEFQTIIATLEAISSVNALDPTDLTNYTLQVATAPAVSATTPAITSSVTGWLNAASALYQAAPELVSNLTGIDPSLPTGIVSLASGLVAMMDPAIATAAFASAFDTWIIPAAPSSGTPNQIAAANNAIAIARFGRQVLLTGYAQALVLAPYLTRPQAITARADCVYRFDQELYLCTGYPNGPIAQSLLALRDAAIVYLTQAIINSAPILQVTTPVSIPVLVAAWQIYQDPTQASALLDLNAIALADFMPMQFEAAAPANSPYAA